MKTGLILFLTILLTSCSFNQAEIERLREENIVLKSQLEGAKFSNENLKDRTVLIPKENKLQLGEEYEAVVMLTFNEKDVTSSITLFDNPPSGRLGDTLKFESVNKIAEIKFTPNDTGIYDLRGVLQQDILGQSYERTFLAKFEVKN